MSDDRGEGKMVLQVWMRAREEARDLRESNWAEQRDM